MKLTVDHIFALKWFAGGATRGEPISGRVLRELGELGYIALLSARHDTFRITDAGRAALADADDGGEEKR